MREWFEVTNVGSAAFDLNELGLARPGLTANVISSTTCKSLAPSQFALFARSADPAVNGMLPMVDATFSFSLVDSNGSVEVRDSATVLDTITWTSVSSGVSSTVDNDIVANFCNGTLSYGDLTNSGTPGAGNTQCP